MSRVREDLMLTYAASKSLTGANVHQGRALIAAYQNAVELATDHRTHGSAMLAAISHVARCEDALRLMVGGR
jgi:hypothetical protein